MGWTVVAAAVVAAAMVPGTHGYPKVQDELNRAVSESRSPGAVAEIRDKHRSWFGAAGLADTATGRPRQAGERFRIGSATKAFVATVVLQLASEGRLRLDDTVEQWLPGTVRGNGNDGSRVQIRQLLNHTSGIFAYTDDEQVRENAFGEKFLEHRFDTFTPQQLVEIAMKHAPVFDPPGSAFRYSNTNFILAGMIVERVTGHSLASEISRRIAGPLGLNGTYLPGTEPLIAGPHPRHYSNLFISPNIYDVTDVNQSSAWAAGGMVSTVKDLNTFFGTLLRGALLSPAMQREMLTTVSTEGAGWIPDTRYGLGVFSQRLSCGATVWGNAGATYGSLTYAMGSRDGKHMVSVNLNGDWTGLVPLWRVLEARFC